MAALTLDRHAVADLYEKKIPDKHTPSWDVEPDPAGGAPATERSHPDQLTELAFKYLSELLETDSDQRLDYILVANPEVTEEHVAQLVFTTDRWLDHEARERMRAIARQKVEDQSGPRQVLLKWFTEAEFARFGSAIEETAFPDRIIATCYALCEAHEVAHAAYLIQQDRALPHVGFMEIKQTPEEVEADLRFVNAK